MHEYIDLLFVLNGKSRPARLYDNKKKTLRNADAISFTVSRNNKGFYKAECASATGDINKAKRMLLIKGLFPLHTMLAGHRPLDSSEYPDEFKQTVRENIVHIMDLYMALDDRTDKLTEVEFSEYNHLLKILCMLYSFQDSDFYRYIIDKTDKCVSGLAKTINHGIGFAIGPCETEDQKRLFCKIVELCRVDACKGINMLSRSVWKHPDMIHNADSSMMLECFDKAVYQLEEYAALCEKDIVAAAALVQNYCIVPCLELALAMFRLRESGDESICSRLRYASVMNRKLRESLDKINKLRNSVITEVINGSRVNMELSGNTENMPPLLYALMLYSWGDLAGDQIKITAIND